MDLSVDTKLKKLRIKLESYRSINKEIDQRSSSPRSISIGQLNTLLYLHLRPIKLVVCK